MENNLQLVAEFEVLKNRFGNFAMEMLFHNLDGYKEIRQEENYRDVKLHLVRLLG